MTQARSKTMTAEQLLKRSSELGPCELIRGELIETGYNCADHGQVAAKFGHRIGEYVEAHALGTVLGVVGCILERGPDTVRAPDIAFIRKTRGTSQLNPGYLQGAPELVVEVISFQDTASAVTAKIDDWLHHGVQLVWVADPKSKIVTAWHPDHRAEVYHVDDTLPGDLVLPGFTLPLRELFKD